jgi:hypothetical protein
MHRHNNNHVSIVSTAFIYNNYNNTSNQTNTQKNIMVVDDEGYATNLIALSIAFGFLVGD